MGLSYLMKLSDLSNQTI